MKRSMKQITEGFKELEDYIKTYSQWPDCKLNMIFNHVKDGLSLYQSKTEDELRHEKERLIEAHDQICDAIETGESKENPASLKLFFYACTITWLLCINDELIWRAWFA